MNPELMESRRKGGDEMSTGTEDGDDIGESLVDLVAEHTGRDPEVLRREADELAIQSLEDAELVEDE